MREDTIKLLNLRRLPARLTAPQAAAVLGFGEHDLPVLIRAKLLKPLGNPAQNAVRYYSAKEIEAHAADPEWLHKATKAVYVHWATQNRNRRSNGFTEGSLQAA